MLLFVVCSVVFLVPLLLGCRLLFVGCGAFCCLFAVCCFVRCVLWRSSIGVVCCLLFVVCCFLLLTVGCGCWVC